MVSNRSCFMVTWIKFKNDLLGVGITRKSETIPLQNITIVDLLYVIMFEDPTQILIPLNSIWLKALSHIISLYTLKLVTTLHGRGSVLGWHLDNSFGLWSRLLARV